MPNREADIRTVSHFVRRLRRVAAHPLAADNGDILDNFASVPITIGRTPDGKTFMRTPLPDEVAFESLATRLRPFVAAGDDLYFVKAFEALERLCDSENDKFADVRKAILAEWHKASERSSRTRAFWVQTSESTKQYSDVELAFAWLYGDTMHGDHDKVETLDIHDRYRAAVGFFSGVAVIAIATSNMLRQFVDLGVIELPAAVFTDEVAVTQTEIRHEVEVFHAEVGVDPTAALETLLRRSAAPLPPEFQPVGNLLDEARTQREAGQNNAD